MTRERLIAIAAVILIAACNSPQEVRPINYEPLPPNPTLAQWCGRGWQVLANPYVNEQARIAVRETMHNHGCFDASPARTEYSQEQLNKNQKDICELLQVKHCPPPPVAGELN
jgi:hypothetical protein